VAQDSSHFLMGCPPQMADVSLEILILIGKHQDSTHEKLKFYL
jgi:hypothetical protein